MESCRLSNVFLYTGVVALKNNVSNDVYNHFTSLHVSIYLLCMENQTSQNIDYSENLCDISLKVIKLFMAHIMLAIISVNLENLANDV